MSENGSAITEAKALYRMVAIGSMSVDAVHELLAVSPPVHRALIAARGHGGTLACLIDGALTFRTETRRHFDAMLVQAGRA